MTKKWNVSLVFAVLLAGMLLILSGRTFASEEYANRKITKFSAVAGNKTVTLKWSTYKDAKGYWVCRVNNKGKKIGKRILVPGGSKNSIKISSLKNGSTYYYKVAAYFKDGGSGVGPFTKPVSCKPYSNVLNTPQITQIKESDGAVRLAWKAVKDASGYEVRYKKAGQKKATSITKNQKKCAIKIRNLKNEKDYYVYVRAVGTRNGKKLRSEWQKVLVTPNTDATRKALLDQVNLTNAYAGGWDNYKVYPKNVAEAYANYGNNGGPFVSNTDYFLWLNLHCIRIYVFTKTNSSKWRLMDSWPCGIGAPGFGNTPSGTWTLAGHQYRDDHVGFYVLYCTFFTGYGTNAIHSESIPHMDPHLTAGRFESAGCVRVDLAHAKFVYDNCEGSTFLVR